MPETDTELVTIDDYQKENSYLRALLDTLQKSWSHDNCPYKQELRTRQDEFDTATARVGTLERRIAAERDKDAEMGQLRAQLHQAEVLLQHERNGREADRADHESEVAKLSQQAALARRRQADAQAKADAKASRAQLALEINKSRNQAVDHEARLKTLRGSFTSEEIRVSEQLRAAQERQARLEHELENYEEAETSEAA